MNDKLSPSRPDGYPVLSGLAALIAVGMVVGLVLGGVAWAGAQVLGLGQSSTSAEDVPDEVGDTLYLPKPEQTAGATGPLITLAPQSGDKGGNQGGSGAADDREKKKKKKKEQEAEITLSAGQVAVGSMEQIDLTGVYPGGEGRILQVQRFEGGAWNDFDVTASVSNETFSTYVLSGQTGPNRFRMIDTDSGAASNEVSVRVG